MLDPFLSKPIKLSKALQNPQTEERIQDSEKAYELFEKEMKLVISSIQTQAM